ncbi:MAG: hypothetical protein JRN27_05785, partial [Nitrososphaerota archaeon]|nr:hypothetical protein [Nitrososphaerota archaeon]
MTVEPRQTAVDSSLAGSCLNPVSSVSSRSIGGRVFNGHLIVWTRYAVRALVEGRDARLDGTCTT